MRRHDWLPLALLLAAAVVLGGTSFLLARADDRGARRLVELSARQAGYRLEEYIGARLQVVESIAAERSAGGLVDNAELSRRAMIVHGQYGGLLAINWIEPDGTISAVNPVAGNEAALGKSIHDHARARPTFLKAQATREPAVTGALTLFQGAPGFASYFPAVRAGQIIGYVNGVFRIDQLVTDCLEDGLLDSYFVRLSRDGRPIFEDDGYREDDLHASARFAVGGLGWQLGISPRPRFVKTLRPARYGWIVLIGGPLALALAYLLRSFLLARDKERQLRERATELAAAKARAEEADRLKSAFLATMSHELRTPLNSVIGFSGTLLSEMVGELNTEQRKQLRFIQGSAQHLLQLIDDLLDISTIEAGELVLDRRELSLVEMVDDVLAIISPLARDKDLTLERSTDAAPENYVGDSRRLRQVLINLLTNAVKFTEAGSVGIELELEDKSLCFRVRDTGIGIAAEHIPHLFQPFYQIDAGLSRRYEGTGLGLAISARLIRMMEGEVSVQSEVGAGTTVEIRLPYPESATSARERQHQ